MKSKIMKLTAIKQNPNNPRSINKHKFDKLVKSIEEFPRMLELRPIVLNKDNIVLGGNMRLKACRQLGLSEVPVVYADDLTDEEQRQFIIKDNVGFGDWDYDMLANEWQNGQLIEWGLDVWHPEESVSNETDYSINSLDAKLDRFLDAKIKNITIPFETAEFETVVEKLEILLDRYECADYRALIYKIFENEKV